MKAYAGFNLALILDAAYCCIVDNWNCLEQAYHISNGDPPPQVHCFGISIDFHTFHDVTTRWFFTELHLLFLSVFSTNSVGNVGRFAKPQYHRYRMQIWQVVDMQFLTFIDAASLCSLGSLSCVIFSHWTCWHVLLWIYTHESNLPARTEMSLFINFQKLFDLQWILYPRQTQADVVGWCFGLLGCNTFVLLTPENIESEWRGINKACVYIAPNENRMID